MRHRAEHGHGLGFRISWVKVQLLALLPHIEKEQVKVEFAFRFPLGAPVSTRQSCKVNTPAGALDQGTRQ